MKDRGENNGSTMNELLKRQKAHGNGKMVRVNRRLVERLPSRFTLTYSGMHEGQMLIGIGIVTNLSGTGIGISGQQLVHEGMELSLMIDLPAVEDPVCVTQSCVSWVNGRRFGVEMVAPEPGIQQILHLSAWNHLIRSATKKC